MNRDLSPLILLLLGLIIGFWAGTVYEQRRVEDKNTIRIDWPWKDEAKK